MPAAAPGRNRTDAIRPRVARRALRNGNAGRRLATGRLFVHGAVDGHYRFTPVRCNPDHGSAVSGDVEYRVRAEGLGSRRVLRRVQFLEDQPVVHCLLVDNLGRIPATRLRIGTAKMSVAGRKRRRNNTGRRPDAGPTSDKNLRVDDTGDHTSIVDIRIPHRKRASRHFLVHLLAFAAEK